MQHEQFEHQNVANVMANERGDVMVQISMAGGTAGLGATSEVDVLQLEIRHEDVSCPMRTCSLVFTSLCQQWALQWGLCGSFYFEQPPSSSWAWLSSLEHVCQLHIGKRITMPLDSAMIEIIVVRLELAKLVQVGLGQIETVEHSWLTQTNCLNSSCLTATICHSWEEQISWSVLASRLARGSCCKKNLYRVIQRWLAICRACVGAALVLEHVCDGAG